MTFLLLALAASTGAVAVPDAVTARDRNACQVDYYDGSNLFAIIEFCQNVCLYSEIRELLKPEKDHHAGAGDVGTSRLEGGGGTGAGHKYPTIG